VSAADAITAALAELERARQHVKKGANRQVRSAEQRDGLRALAFAWFRSHKKAVAGRAAENLLSIVDAPYQLILDAAEINTGKAKYLGLMSDAKLALLDLRAQVIASEGQAQSTPEAVPDFSALVGDDVMRKLLHRRWDECQKCVAAQAHLASIVMMGGRLEAMFVARANKMANKSHLVKAAAAPKDPKTNKVMDIRDWTLRPYIDVGHELGWITKSAKDVAGVLSEYRNYVHPEKERRHNVELPGQDTVMLWGVTKSLVQQLLASAR
jgi:hypothetical protein